MLSAYVALTLLGSALAQDAFPFEVPFDIKKVVDKAVEFPSHSWEYGTTVEALFEIYNPELSVFGEEPFPAPDVSREDVQALQYAHEKIVFGKGKDALSPGDGAVGDPAALGIAAYLMGKSNETYAAAAEEQLNYVVDEAPRHPNGAISHRASVVETWDDFVYMAPPYMAYVGADTGNNTLLEDALHQIEAYHEIHIAPMLDTVPEQKLWLHIVGPQSADLRAWGTGNGWAAAGMTRVLASILKAPAASPELKLRAKILVTTYMQEMMNAMLVAKRDGHLYRNYLDDYRTPAGYGEWAGMSMIANAVLRMSVLVPEVFGRYTRYQKFATDQLILLGEVDGNGKPYVTEEGVVRPTVNPLNWFDLVPFEKGSPEAQGFVSLLYAAFRDCVNADQCDAELEPSPDYPTISVSVGISVGLPTPTSDIPSAPTSEAPELTTSVVGGAEPTTDDEATGPVATGDLEELASEPLVTEVAGHAARRMLRQRAAATF